MSKVKFGLSNAYWAKCTVASDGTVTFGEPVKEPGFVSLSLSNSATENIFWADNIQYYRSAGGQGYTGTMEFAKLSEDFRQEILGETLDSTDKVMVENSADVSSPFALLYQVEEDAGKSYRVLYYIQAGKIPIEASTLTDTTEPQTDTVDITVSPVPDTMDLKAHTTDDTPTATVEGWFTSVWRPN